MAQVLRAKRPRGAGQGGRPTHRFAVSDDEARFRQVGARFIGERLGAGGGGAAGLKWRSSAPLSVATA